MKLLSFNQFLTEREQILLEEYNYKQIFSKVISLADEESDRTSVETIADRYIRLSREILIKNFRVVWFLKIIQLYAAYNYLSTASGNNDITSNSYMEHPYTTKLLNEMSQKTGVSVNQIKVLIGNISPADVLRQYEHLLHLNIKEINEYNPQDKMHDQVLADLNTLEKAWAAELEGTVKYTEQPLVDQSDYDDPNNYCIPIIDFGNGWYWVDLESDSCDLESRAMGHCGNSGNSGSTLLSLRYLNKRRKDEASWLWEPHVTFELEEDNMLGQMKGKNNDKPSQKYHQYIIALLTAKRTVSTRGDSEFIIKGIRGGGYKPETNFSLSDLTTEQAEQVVKDNPNLDVLTMLKNAYGERVRESKDGKSVIISGFKAYNTKSDECDLYDLYYEDSRQAISKNQVEEILKDGYIDLSYNGDYQKFSDLTDWVTTNKDNVALIEAWLDKNEVAWREDEDTDGWQEYVDHYDVESITDCFQRAYLYAEEQGMNDEAMKDFRKAVNSGNNIIYDDWDTFELVFNKSSELTKIQNLLAHGNPNDEDSYAEKEVFWEWQEPYNGWDGGVDDDNFNDILNDALRDL